MKRLFVIQFILFLICTTAMAQTPSWVVTHPFSEKEYIGIGIAPLSDDNYVQKATQNALSDITSQITNKMEVSSFMHTVDVDGKSRELFEEKINSSMISYLEGHKLEDSYQDGRNYYVYYTLNKELYKKNLNKHRNQAIQQGLDYYQQGLNAMNMNSLANAAQLFAKGLEVTEPWLFTQLTTYVSGEQIDVPTKLYQAYISIFDGLTITTNQANVEGEAFKPVIKPIAACLSKDGYVVPNVKLVASFVTGAGDITPAIATDYNGTSEFYIKNITSKDPVQEIHITIDSSFINELPASYRELLNTQTWPAAKVTINLTKQAYTAYINVSNDDLTSVKRQIASVLSNNYFTVTEDSKADILIDLSTTIELGKEVQGGIYNLNECLCSLQLKFYDNNSHKLLLDYNIDRLKVLTPIHSSVEQTEISCTREVMKRVKRELPNMLKKININY